MKKRNFINGKRLVTAIQNQRSISVPRVPKYAVGEHIDVRDTENVWCVGEIKSIVTIKQEMYAYIHYEGWNSAYNEYIPLGNERLASLGFYTNRGDIPRYILNGNGNCNVGLVLRSENDIQRINASLNQMEQELSGFQRAMTEIEHDPSGSQHLRELNEGGESAMNPNLFANHVTEILNQLNRVVPPEIVHEEASIAPAINPPPTTELLENSNISENANSRQEIGFNSEEES